MDDRLEPCWIVGDPSECANRLDQLYDEVDGFGYVLTTTHDPDDHGLEQTSLRLLEDDDLSGLTAHATCRTEIRRDRLT
jgi:alkanesulfonate monooxygenase SsuD/methylene tetrahydromethanopterin reductase-like flavin-dependent oxidoreductase (luciferase family)